MIDSVTANGFKDLTPSEMNKCHHIELIDKNQQPLRQRMRPIPYSQQKAFREIIEQQLEAKIIRKSNSPYRSPVNLVLKPDGSLRVTINYKWLNQISVKNSYPLPNIEEILGHFSKAKYFTKIDCFSGFYQIKLDEQSAKYTAFACDFGLFEYNVMPMGLQGAPGTFQEAVNEILAEEIKEGFVKVYMDDVSVYSEDEDSHLIHVGRVVDKFKAHTHLKLKNLNSKL